MAAVICHRSMGRIAKEKLPENQKEHISALRSIRGKTLAKLSRCQYFFNDEPDDEDEGDVELTFEDGSVITLFILADGESVGAKTALMEIPGPFDVDEDSRCSWKHLPLSDKAPWSGLIGAEVTEVTAVFDKYAKLNAEVLSGWKITFGKHGDLCYFNCGDNGRLLRDEEPPADKDVETKERIIGNDI